MFDLRPWPRISKWSTAWPGHCNRYSLARAVFDYLPPLDGVCAIWLLQSLFIGAGIFKYNFTETRYISTLPAGKVSVLAFLIVKASKQVILSGKVFKPDCLPLSEMVRELFIEIMFAIFRIHTVSRICEHPRNSNTANNNKFIPRKSFIFLSSWLQVGRWLVPSGANGSPFHSCANGNDVWVGLAFY